MYVVVCFLKITRSHLGLDVDERPVCPPMAAHIVVKEL